MKNMVLKPRMVNIQRLEQALHHFKDKGHPSYQNLEINEAYDPEFVFDQLTQEEAEETDSPPTVQEQEKEVEESEQDPEVEDDSLAAVKDHQSKNSENYLMAGVIYYQFLFFILSLQIIKLACSRILGYLRDSGRCTALI